MENCVHSLIFKKIIDFSILLFLKQFFNFSFLNYFYLRVKRSQTESILWVKGLCRNKLKEYIKYLNFGGKTVCVLGIEEFCFPLWTSEFFVNHIGSNIFSLKMDPSIWICTKTLTCAYFLFLFFNVTTSQTGPHKALHPGCGVKVVHRQRVLEQYPWITPCTCLVIFVLTSGRATEAWPQDNEVFLWALTLRNWRHLCNLIQSHRLCML